MLTTEISAFAKLYLLITALQLGSLPSVISVCESMCECEGAVINCTCTAINQTVSLYLSKDDLPSSHVFISDCNTAVLYQWNTMVKEPLKTLHIKSVRRIKFNEYVLMDQFHIDTIIIQDSGIDELGEYALADAQHIKSLVFNNVTISLIKKWAFYALEHLKEFTFIDCTIDEIQSNAFDEISHVDKFAILNTKINTLKNHSLEVKHVRQITFTNLSVGIWESRAFVPRHVNLVKITHSSIEELQEEAFAAENVSKIMVYHSRFTHVFPKAFAGLNDVGRLVMVNDTFSKASKDSFITDTEVIVQQTRFSCLPEDICSLLGNHTENVKNPFITNSTCMSPEHEIGKPLISLSDDENLCSTERSVRIEKVKEKNEALIININSDLILFAMLMLKLSKYVM